MEILLKFYEDDRGKGLLHSNALDTGFNAFYHPIGIFHDIMEHNFEDIHPYFKGEYAFNYAGEIAANGMCAWYVYGLCLTQRISDILPATRFQQALVNNISLSNELYEGDFREFGEQVLSKVPNRYKPHPNYSSILHHHWDTWCRSKDEYKDNPKNKLLIRSMTLPKLEALYGWGYYRAKRMFPQNDHNRAVMAELYSDIKHFVRSNDIDKLMNSFTYLKAVIKPGKHFEYKLTLIDNYCRNEHPLFDWQDSMYAQEQY